MSEREEERRGEVRVREWSKRKSNFCQYFCEISKKIEKKSNKNNCRAIQKKCVCVWVCERKNRILSIVIKGKKRGRERKREREREGERERE